MRLTLSTLQIPLLSLAAFAAMAFSPALSADAIAVFPQQVELSDAYARRQVLVSMSEHDVTREATYQSLNPELFLVDARGYLSPKADGTGTLLIKHGGMEQKLPVVVKGSTTKRDVDFVNEIVPILSRYGCNAGGCHGKQRGQNGFQLSLFGFDSVFDFQTIVQDARGRRVFAPASGTSLMLLKATGAVPHGGGKRFETTDEAHQLFTAWLEEIGRAHV